jgi:hypothetical protein
MSDLAVDDKAALNSLRTLRNAFQHAVLETTRVVLDETTKHAKETRLWNDKSGATRASIKGHATSMTSGFIEAGGMSRFLEFGTPPHDIVAKNASALRFTVNGTTFFRRMVHHPGTSERPFMQQARDFGQHVADYAAEHYVQQAIQRAR